MRRFFVFLLLLCLLPNAVVVLAASEKAYTLVIDAGHGGKDPGAVGKKSFEKDLNLQLALRTGKLIKERFPEVNVVYTRKTDVFLPLQDRANIVNRNNADLFLCIHANSSESKSAHGVETFVLGTDKMDKNLDVAMRENSVITLEQGYETTYMGFDPKSIDSYIMFELMQNNYMDQSLLFASNVQRQFVSGLQRYDRGVRQAAFWVLLQSACPSVLFEMGFVSNPEEEEWMRSELGQQQMAEALCKAFSDQYQPASVQVAVKATETAPKPDPKTEQKTEPESASENDSTKATNDTIGKTPENAENKYVNMAPPVNANTTRYAVQLMASRSLLAPGDPQLRGVKCTYVFVSGWYKYFYGDCAEKAEAIHLQEEVKDLFPGCWVTTIPQPQETNK